MKPIYVCIATVAVGLESSPVGETNVATLISSPDDLECIRIAVVVDWLFC